MKLDGFLDLMDTLLGESGCPWDRAQTHESLREYLLEESYEVIEAINKGDMAGLKEELGDLLLQVVFHAKLAEKAGEFDMDDIIAGVSEKLVSRHTHVFGGDEATHAEDVVAVWEANKAKEKPQTPREAMEAVPKALPALVRAQKVIKRSKRKNHDTGALIQEIHLLLDSLVEIGDSKVGFEKFGIIMLTLTKLSSILEINAEFSLTNATEEFINTDSEM